MGIDRAKTFSDFIFGDSGDQNGDQIAEEKQPVPLTESSLVAHETRSSDNSRAKARDPNSARSRAETRHDYVPSAAKKVEILMQKPRPNAKVLDLKANGAGLCCPKVAETIARGAGQVGVVEPGQREVMWDIPDGAVQLLWKQTPLREKLLQPKRPKPQQTLLPQSGSDDAVALPVDNSKASGVFSDGGILSGIFESTNLFSSKSYSGDLFTDFGNTNANLNSVPEPEVHTRSDWSNELSQAKIFEDDAARKAAKEEERKEKYRQVVESVCPSDDFRLLAPPSRTAPPHPHSSGSDPKNKKMCCLVSGGKDSLLTLHLAHAMGYEIACLATFVPPPHTTKDDEADSYMFQSVGTTNVELIAESLGVPLIVRTLVGGSVSTDSNEYISTHNDEVEDMFHTLYFAMHKYGCKFVSAGAVFSDYQRMRVENVCTRLGMLSVAPLWRWPQEEVLDMVQKLDMKAILLKVASMGVSERELGKTTTECIPLFKKLHKQFGFHIAGEGGEYETFVMDAPLFKHPLQMVNKRLVADKSMDVYHLADVKMSSGTREDNEDEDTENLRADIKTRDSESLHVKLFDQFLVDVYPSSLSDPWDKGAMGTNEGGSRMEIFIEPANPKVESFEGRWEEFDNLKVTREHFILTDSWDVSCIPMLLTSDQQDEADFWDLDATNQARRLFRAIIVHLGKRAMGGRTLRHVTHVDLQLRDMADFASVNHEYIQVFPALQPPTRCCVGACLPEGIRLRIRLTLSAPPDPDECFRGIGVEHALIRNAIFCQRPAPDAHRDVLHVQSMSSWAMACIGPYSQAHAVNRLEHVNEQEVCEEIEYVQKLRSKRELFAIQTRSYCAKASPRTAKIMMQDIRNSKLMSLKLKKKIFYGDPSRLFQFRLEIRIFFTPI